MKNILALVALLLSVLSMQAQPKAEIRAVWLTTNSGSDWPKSVYNVEKQKASLCDILDKLEAANFNTIVFQAQVKGDVAWMSDIQPAMRNITGNGANSFTYDVCEFVIEECHKRKMECHAWIVPYRIGTKSEADKYANNKVKHVTVTNPELCVLYNSAYYLDPGLPATREYLVNLYKELISNYDFDGVNFDYTRYPGSDFGDDASFAAYNPDGLALADWRRQNINTFIAEFYAMAKSINPKIKVGAAPIGTYKNLSGYHNATAYGSYYQDACQWMQSGNHDLLIPQMYWNEKYGFTPNMGTWVDNSAGRQLVVGLAPYKMVDGSNDWEVSVVTDQIEKVRAREGMSGVCFFRTMHVMDESNAKQAALYKELKENYFKYPAHIVPMDYNGITKPDAPTNLEVTREGNQYIVNWDEATTSDPSAPVKYYCVYASESSPVDISDIKNCVGFAIPETEFTFTSDAEMNIVVTAFDINYYESEAAQVASVEDVAGAEINITRQGNSIVVEGLDGAQRVQVYNISGMRIYDGYNAVVPVNVRGLYIVKVADKIAKVLI